MQFQVITYYQKLYTTQNISSAKIDEYSSEINIPKLKESDKNMLLNEFPSCEECKHAVNNMKKEKSPGLDCLPSEFYQTFQSEIGFIFYEALKDMYIIKVKCQAHKNYQ